MQKLIDEKDNLMQKLIDEKDNLRKEFEQKQKEMEESYAKNTLSEKDFQAGNFEKTE
jgi:hypothetical protein